MLNGRSAPLEFLVAEAAGLPEGLDAIVATADLQGIVYRDEEPELLGTVVARRLGELSARGELPPKDRMGICLCGDMFVRTELDRRGGMGDVRHVFRAFASAGRWVAGVAGNHDSFGSTQQPFGDDDSIHLLDGESVAPIGGLVIGGVGGVVGRPDRPGRRAAPAFLEVTERVLRDEPDLLLLHQGPAPRGSSKGLSGLRELLASNSDRDHLVAFGHRPWRAPLEEGAQPQLLNVHARVVILSAPSR